MKKNWMNQRLILTQHFSPHVLEHPSLLPLVFQQLPPLLRLLLPPFQSLGFSLCLGEELGLKMKQNDKMEKKLTTILGFKRKRRMWTSGKFSPLPLLPLLPSSWREAPPKIKVGPEKKQHGQTPKITTWETMQRYERFGQTRFLPSLSSFFHPPLLLFLCPSLSLIWHPSTWARHFYIGEWI